MKFFIRLKILLTVSSTFFTTSLAYSEELETGHQPNEADPGFFESRIRPVLAQECYECHSTNGKRKNDLALDTRDGARLGGKSGPAIVPGDPVHSLLLHAIRHEHKELQMPKNGPKLEDKVIADFTAWIAGGAWDPRDEPPLAAAAAKSDGTGDWSSVLSQRKNSLWSFQPITNPPVPEVPGVTVQPEHPIDRFLQAQQRSAGLEPSPRADRVALLRRLSYLLNGLPPTREMQQSFLDDPSANTYDQLVNQLLASPAYGETWGRHWLDWFRYADSHGSEGDPAIPYAWRYRDYIIRALNADVPYAQLVREGLAGDLLPHPRLHPGTGQNESMIGAAQLRLVLHAFAPTDPLDEFVTFTDNQIDVVTKAFLGLTVSCARCHHHKFDPVSQEDYYALFGILGSARPALLCLDSPSAQFKTRGRMWEIKSELRKVMAAAWKKTSDALPALLPTFQVSEAMKREGDLAGIGPWFSLRDVPQEKFLAHWQALQERYRILQQQDQNFHRQSLALRDGKTEASKGLEQFQWFARGPNLKAERHSGGDFSCAVTGSRIIEVLFPAGFYSQGFSDKDSGVLMSQRFKNEGGKIWVRVAGQGGAVARYVIDNFPRSGLIYPKFEPKSDLPQWQEWDVNYWKGEVMHLELTTAGDAPVEAKAENTRSWFGLTEARYVPNPEIRPVDLPATVLSAPIQPQNLEELAKSYQEILRASITAWEQEQADSDQMALLSCFLRCDLLPNTLDAIPAAQSLLTEYRRLEEALPFPVRVPGVMEADPFKQALYVKGDLKQPAAEVPHRFLEALDSTPFPLQNSGRLQLAEAILAENNPLTDRVIVNRVWHHLFGRGLVATVDNFGKLGRPPSHPKLLDHLAQYFRAHGGSIKELIRYLVTTEAFQASSEVSLAAAEKDPGNELLTHFSRRRLTAESIRDTLLCLSGNLKDGSPSEGADVNGPFRSVYLKLIRNNLPPLLTAFDFPPPVTTRGSRDSTNVPAQSLALLNDPQVQAWARDWALRGKKEAAPEKRVTAIFQEAFSRSPEEHELKESLNFLETCQQQENRENEALQRLMDRQTKLERDLDVLRASVSFLKKPAAFSTVEPYAEWDFEQDATDSRGRLPLQLKNGAKIVHGALVLDGVAAYAVSEVLPINLEEKTLEAWVQLDGLNQAGGGVLTTQNKDGSIFESMVYAEKESGRWVAGSEFYRRTQSFQAPVAEKGAAQKPVHIAMIWKKDGTVTAWREGKPYGQAVQNKEPVIFTAQQTLLVLGCRHLPPSGNRSLQGRITRARLYDRALTTQELEQNSALEKDAVTDADIVAALSPDQKENWMALQKESLDLSRQLSGRTVVKSDPETAWAALAHALMNTKELIYLR